MKVLLIVGLVCVLGVLVIGVVTSAVSRFKATKVSKALVRELGPRNVMLVEAAATCHRRGGRDADRSPAQGCLVLTTDELVFAPWLPAPRVRFPRLSMTEVSAGRSLRGGSRGKRLLRITWTGSDGSEASAAWQVADLDAWLRALQP